MTLMKPLTFSLPDVQLDWLKRHAAVLGISVSELLRRIIDTRRFEDPMTQKELR